MKWSEFKEKMEEEGIKDDDDILYLDLYPDAGIRIYRLTDGTVGVLD